MIKAAIFDMDGLLIDSERIIMQACIEAARRIGINYTREGFVELIGRSGPDATRLMVEQLGSEANFNLVMQYLDESLDAQGHHFPLKPGVRPLLDHYRHQGVRCGVASSSPMHHITHRLQQVQVLDYFSHLTSGHEVAKGKPEPDIYLRAMQKLEVSAAECIAFEDSEPGARAAIAAGLRVVVVPDLKAPSQFVRDNCYQVVDSLEDWLEVVWRKQDKLSAKV